jgi:hypothetical protein
MAQLESNFDFTGKLGNISAYKSRGSEKIILRTKGGPTTHQFKTSQHYAKARRNNAEFGGRAQASKWVRQMMHPLQSVGDYNAAGPLNALIKPIQALDTVNDHGQRNIEFSKDSSLLHGFSLNKRNTFDSIIRNPVAYSIDRVVLTATVGIPQLLPNINFFNPGKHAFYSIVAVLGIVPDLFYSKNGYNSSWKKNEPEGSKFIESEWFASLEGSKAFTLSLQYQLSLPNQSFMAMLSAGIKFGTMGVGGVIQQVPYAGAAKIMLTA